MQPYYAQAAMPGMGPGGAGMDPRYQQMQMQGMGGMGMNGMMHPGMMQQGGPNGMNGMMGGGYNNMGAMGQAGMGYGQAYRNLGYDYQLPALGYTPDASWGAWDLANARYSGGRLERGFFDNIMSSLANFFSTRHLSEDSARNAHRRVYHQMEGEDSGNKSLGGAAAYQAYLIWDRDHHSAYHSYPTTENRERLVGLAVAELFGLWERVNPRSPSANVEDAAQYAAATAKYLFDRHYDLPSGGHNHGHGRRHHSGYGADDDSDSGSEGRRMRRRSGYGHMQGMQPGMQPGMGPMGGMGGGMGHMMPGGPGGPMMGPAGMGMTNPGYGGMGMQGGMQNAMHMQGGMGMNPMMQGGMGYGGMNHMGGMGGMGGMNPMLMNGGYGNPNNEAQAAPGMHPYHWGSASGVAFGNTPIDQMGQPTFPGGPGRSWYAYGQPRGY